MEGGGMFGEKKSDIFDLIPKQYIPKTILNNAQDMVAALDAAKRLGYPLIAKPNVGERGNWVKKIDSEVDLIKYVNQCHVDFLLQELVVFPMELGVFYFRYPNEKNGRVTSIVRKKFLSVTGDGESSIDDLIRQNTRALLTADLESDFLKRNGKIILKKGETILIEPIGNHCRGTQFLNDNKRITEELSKAIDKLAKQIDGFYYGRFDLKCDSYEDLTHLQNFKILELNGAGAEAAHIYEPGYPLMKAYRDVFWHFSAMSKISKQNRQRGDVYWSFQKGLRKWKDYKKHYRLMEGK